LFDYHKSVDADHGKIEIRKYRTTSDMSWLQGKENWKNPEIICMVEPERKFGDKTERETSYYMDSIEKNAENFAKAVRSRAGWDNDYLLKVLAG
jgi:hypothetical protein